MADKEPTPIERVDAAITAYLHAEYENAALLAGWVIVAEFITSEGEPDITAFAAEGLPYWRVNGLLDAAPYEMGYVGEDEELDD
jgi:hypothetical protein